MVNSTLCLYTAQFPYGLGEQFIETEIKYLAETFQNVFIFPSNATGPLRHVPENVIVLQFDHSGYSTLKGIRSLGKWLFYCIGDVVKHKNKKLFVSNVLRTAYSAFLLKTFLHQNKLLQAIHYTYWFDDWSTVLSILKSKKQIPGFISRAHRFDLYEDRRKDGFIPFRKFQLRYVSKLFLISKNGKNYMEQKYPKHKSKYTLAYLGVENNFGFREHQPNNNQFLIVSCSRLVDIKRVDLIVKSLSLIKDIPLRWIHFGGGELFEDIKNLADTILPANIEWELKGHVDNQFIYKFYANNPVDCLINVSSSEGLPVTLMEAISFGIPVIATNVGGTSEIANNNTGILLTKNPTSHEIATTLKAFIKAKAKTIEFRENVYKFWFAHFNAQKNYLTFKKNINEGTF